jgi:hypothetical protein
MGGMVVYNADTMRGSVMSRLFAVALPGIVGLLLASLCGQAAGQTDADKYEVRFNRPYQKDWRWRMVGSLESATRDMAVVEGVPRHTEVSAQQYEFDLDIRVRQVGDRGRLQRVEVRVRHLTVSAGEGRPRAVLPEGSRIIATVGEPTTFTADGITLGETELAVLRDVLRIERRPTDEDALFAPDEPKAVGETWPVRKQPIMDLLKASGLELGNDDITGSATLQKATPAGAAAALDVTATLTVRQPARRSTTGPTAAVVTTEHQLAVTATLPTRDGNLPRSMHSRQTQETRTETTVEGQAVVALLRQTRERKVAITPLTD